MRVKFVCMLTLMGLSAVGFDASVDAQVKYPNKPIQLVVGYGPGGAQDIFWRTIKDDLEKAMKVPITIVNKAGAGGGLAADFVANSKNDGYTVVAVGHSIKTVIPAVDPKATIADIEPLGLTFRMPFVLATRMESNFKTLKDVVAFGKSKPGSVTCATQGVQSEAYFDLEFIAQRAGVKFSHVPIPNAADVMANVLGGHVDLCLSSFPAMVALYKGGKLRVLGVTPERRLPDYPEIPTFVEQGFPEATLDGVGGLWGPKNMPPEVFTAWRNAFQTVLGNPEMQANLRQKMMYVDLMTDRDQINKYVQDLYKTLSQIAVKEGIQLK